MVPHRGEEGQNQHKCAEGPAPGRSFRIRSSCAYVGAALEATDACALDMGTSEADVSTPAGGACLGVRVIVTLLAEAPAAERWTSIHVTRRTRTRWTRGVVPLGGGGGGGGVVLSLNAGREAAPQ